MQCYKVAAFKNLIFGLVFLRRFWSGRFVNRLSFNLFLHLDGVSLAERATSIKVTNFLNMLVRCAIFSF